MISYRPILCARRVFRHGGSKSQLTSFRWRQSRSNNNVLGNVTAAVVGTTSCRGFACAGAATTTTTTDPYDRYRTHTPSESVLQELLEETKRTLQATDPVVYQQVLGEINEASKIAAADDKNISELGPTGRYLYAFVTVSLGSDSVREYRRVRADNNDIPENSEKTTASDAEYETVLGPHFLLGLQAVSLSADESMVAVLVEFPNKSSDKMEVQLWLRSIATARQVQVDTGGSTPVVVEFGPQQQDDNGSHLLSWVTLDGVGRPSTAHMTLVDPKTLVCLTSSLLYHSNDPVVHVDVQRCKGCEYLAVHARTQTATETYLLGNRYAERGLELVHSFEDSVQYHLDVGTEGDVVTMAACQSNNESKANNPDLGIEYSVWETTVDALPIIRDWGRRLVVPKTNFFCIDMELFQDFVAVFERSTLDGRHQIRVTERYSSVAEWIVPIPEAEASVAVVSPVGNMYYQSQSLRFALESPMEPRKIYEYHVPSRRLSLLSKKRSVDDGIIQERTVVSSRDGTLVPLTLVYRKGVEDSNSVIVPAVLMGYGAYGHSMNLTFDPTLQPLLDRGFLLAYAHTRGGGELGKSWHHRGRLHGKSRAVEDYIACAEAITGYLLNKPVRLVAKAFSAGGVIVGAAVNRRPDLFRAVALTNAFLDVQATLKNKSLHLTQHEWDEYGNPLEDERMAESIASYCPVVNANGDSASGLPSFLLIGTMDDKDVPVWNPIVFGKKLRAQANGKADVLLYTEGQGGHQMLGTRSRVAALEAAFLLRSTTNK